MRIKIIDKQNMFTTQERQFYRRLVGVCLKELGEGKKWSSDMFRVIMRKSKRRFLTGKGRYHVPLIWLVIPYGIVCHNELVHLIRHEIYHTHGLRHKDMDRGVMRTCYCTKGESPHTEYLGKMY